MIGELFYLNRGRNRFQDIGHGLFRSGYDAERGSAAALEDTKQGAANAILANDVLLRIVAVTHLSDVTDSNLRAIDHFNRQIVQGVDPRRKSIDVDRILRRAKFGRATGKDQRLRIDRVRYISLRQVLFLKFSRIEIDRDESLLATERERNRDAWNADQTDADLIEREVKGLLFGKCVAADAILQDRNGGSVVLNNERWCRAGWKLP